MRNSCTPRLCAAVSAVVCALFASACLSSGKDEQADETKPSATRAAVELPPMVDIPAGEVVSGFSTGRLRKSFELDAFRITKHPITNAQYQRCVEAGACDPPDETACGDRAREALVRFKLDAGDSPAICVGAKNAAAYCDHLGGDLPTLNQWFYAARGRDPQPYAWGTEAPSCDRHPRVQTIEPPGPDDIGKLVRYTTCAQLTDEGRLRVGKHEKGASPTGLEDVLLTPGELLATTDKAHFPACAKGFSACTILGRNPGALETAAPARGGTQHDAYAFRCVMEGE